MQPFEIKTDLANLIFSVGCCFFGTSLAQLGCQSASKATGNIKFYINDQQKEVSP
jgi:hypothetical protein